MHAVCSQIVLKLYLARIGRPDILWSGNKLARAVTKWTKACDKRLARLISYIHHRSEYRQYCHVGNTAQQCRLGLFQDSDFAGDLDETEVDRVCANQVQDRPQGCMSWPEIVRVSASESEQAQDDCGERLRTLRACFAPGSFSKKQTPARVHSARISFELLESFAKTSISSTLKYLIKNGVNAIMPRV